MEIMKKLTMDPMQIFPEEVIEEIFSHLSGRELIKKCTLVSPVWNRLIGSSFHCMNKVKVQGTTDTLDVAFLSSSPLNRRYQHITFYPRRKSGKQGTFSSCELYAFMHSKRWKTVDLWCSTFPSTSVFIKLVKTFEATVERLFLLFVDIDERDIEVPQLLFNRLTHLKVHNVQEEKSREWVCELFLNCKNLKTLVFPINCFDGPKSYFEMWKNNKELKALNVTINKAEGNFSDGDKFEWQLEEMVVKSLCVPSSKTSESFLTFFSSQMKIKELDLTMVPFMATSLLKIAMSMKLLKKLKILVREYFDPLIQLRTNKSIEILDLHFSVFNINDNQMIIALLKRMPNLKNISLQKVNVELAHFILKNLKSVNQITVTSDTTENIIKIQKLLPKIQICSNVLYFE